MEVQKAKDKPKKIETVSLDEMVDIKGWKALGNRLSEYKVTKVNLVQDEETGLEEGDEDNELVEAAESEKDSQSPKKKEEPGPNQWLEDGEQAILFAAPEKPRQQSQPRPEPKPKVKVEQQNLFGGESKKPNQSQSQNESGEEEDSGEEEIDQGQEADNEIQKPQRPEPKPKPKDDDKSFGVGETIEFDL
jgi:topoisomerase-4 subunit A